MIIFMVSLSQIEQDLTAALKAKDQLKVDTLRALKTRITNEKIAKMSAKGGSPKGRKDLEESDIVVLVRSEVKRRKEAAASYKEGGRPELEAKELSEAGILEQYLPQQMSEAQLSEIIDKEIAENNFTAKDFGPAMGKLKAKVGLLADGAMLAKILKEKLK